MSDTPHPRSIRSFVTRAGRITMAQERALTQLWPKYGIDPGSGTLDLPALFGRAAPCTLEIGFGNGENLVTLAAAHPERDYLGIEVHRPGVGRALLGFAERAAGNARVICHDAVEVLERQIAPGSLDEVLILFPDPWPTKRHHKRRLVQAPFVALIARALAADGRLHLATDWEPYAQEMLAVLAAAPGLENSSPGGGFSPRPAERLPTRFERVIRRSSSTPRRGTFGAVRVSSPTSIRLSSGR